MIHEEYHDFQQVRTIADLERRWEELSRQLAAIAEMRPGSLVGRYRKCGKSSGHFAQPGDPRRGPGYSLTRQVGGKTVTRVLPAGPEVDRVQSQIAEYRRFRALTREMIEVSEQLCQARLQEGAERKGGWSGRKKGLQKTLSSEI